MKRENGIEKGKSKRRKIGDDRENQERREEAEEFILATGEKSWREVLDIITARGSIRGVKV